MTIHVVGQTKGINACIVLRINAGDKILEHHSKYGKKLVKISYYFA